MRRSPSCRTALAAAVLALLAACSPRDQDKPSEAVVTNQPAPAPMTTASDPAATASAALGQAVDNAKEAAASALDKASAATADARESAGQKADALGEQAKDKVAAAAVATRDKARELAGDAKELAGDAATTARVKSVLAADARLSALAIEVDTQDGVVKLTGSTADDAARRRATELVQGVKGVSKVDNQLKVGAS